MSKNAKGRRKPGLNENYARELLELHTLGVDGGYTQKDVTELARILTGWTIERPNKKNADRVKDWQFRFNRRMHDPGSKVLLGETYHADLGSRAQDVLLLTMTEFGRTIEENGNGASRAATWRSPPISGAWREKPSRAIWA